METINVYVKERGRNLIRAEIDPASFQSVVGGEVLVLPFFNGTCCVVNKEKNKRGNRSEHTCTLLGVDLFGTVIFAGCSDYSCRYSDMPIDLDRFKYRFPTIDNPDPGKIERARS